MIFVVSPNFETYQRFMRGNFRHVNMNITREYVYIGPNDADKMKGIERNTCYFDLGLIGAPEVEDVIVSREFNRIELSR